jgi:type II secretion system protein N
MSENAIATSDLDSGGGSATRSQKIIRVGGWVALGLFLLIFFTILKLPKDRIKNFVNGSISAYLAPQGISFYSDRSNVSLLPISYTMEEVKLGFPPPDLPVTIESVSVSPSLFSLFRGRQAASLYVSNGKGSLAADISAKKSDLSVSLRAKKFDLGKIGLLPILVKIKAAAVLDGSANINGDINTPSSLTGSTELNLSAINIDKQNIASFNIPNLAISEGKAFFSVEKTKLKINTLTLGKPGSSDDITAKVTGEISLGRNWESSMLDVKAIVTLSPAVIAAFPLVDALLGSAKLPDGSYSIQLTGPASMPNYTPLGAK